ncbi:serine/threonine-protein phosphatase [Clostridium tertium]|uniref:PP2C-family Ser/Thr phosphatase n=1 Tax=Clostridium tertium TaxID=1559 RepID=A0A6N3A8U4_9CLOT
MRVKIDYYTDKGLVKDNNQDALIIKIAKSKYGRIGMFGVCDGMGGLSSGEIASSTVVRGLSIWFDNEFSDIDFLNITDDEIFTLINDQISLINEKIINYGIEKGEQLGTTLSLLIIVSNKYYICQVGDSRIYLIQDNIYQLTKDQTFVQREIDNGNLTKEEGSKHYKRNVLLQCIGVRKDIEPVYSIGEVKEFDKYLLASDGLYKSVDDLEFKNYIYNKEINESNSISRDMVNLSMARGERDNITSIIVEVS